MSRHERLLMSLPGRGLVLHDDRLYFALFGAFLRQRPRVGPDRLARPWMAPTMRPVPAAPPSPCVGWTPFRSSAASRARPLCRMITPG